MAEDNLVRGKRDVHLERMRKKYPDRKFEDDEEIFATIGEDYDQYEHDIDEYKGREKALSDMFAADPRSAQFLMDMHKGEDPVLGLVRNFGIEIKDYLDDPEMQEKIAEANKDYVERVAKNRELEAEYNANLDATKAALEQFQQKRGLSDEQIDAIFAKALSIATDGVMGKFTPETLDMVSKAMNYEQDVAAAGLEGEIAGRNAKITEVLRKKQEGDGTMPLNGKNNSPVQQRGRSIFDLASEAM